MATVAQDAVPYDNPVGCRMKRAELTLALFRR